MGFYQELSRFYDEIFAVDTEEMAFVRTLLQGAKRILDIGCGTGNKTVHFSANAEEVAAVDLDEEMIAKAKALNARDNIRYGVVNMLDIGRAFSGTHFDGIACLGNTLVHLPSTKAIQTTLEEMRALLAPGGVCVIQILNYDRIIAKKIQTLPVIETPNVRFMRGYEWHGGEMHFVTALELKKTKQVLHNDIVLYPLGKNDFSRMLLNARFRQTDYYGSYQGVAYTEASFVTIAVCR